MPRHVVILVVVGYAVMALAFGVFVQMQKPFATIAGLANGYTLGAILGIALPAFAIPGIVALIVWAFMRFRAERATGPLITWFILLAVYCALMGYGAIYGKQKQAAAAPEAPKGVCYSDRELMASIVIRNVTFETVQVEQCAIRSGNRSLTAKWESYLRRHNNSISEQETLVAQAYRRLFGSAWEARLAVDMQAVRTKAMATDFGGRTPAQCASAYEGFFEAQSYVKDSEIWSSMFNSYRVQYDIERRQVPRC